MFFNQEANKDISAQIENRFNLKSLMKNDSTIASEQIQERDDVQ